MYHYGDRVELDVGKKGRVEGTKEESNRVEGKGIRIWWERKRRNGYWRM